MYATSSRIPEELSVRALSMLIAHQSRADATRHYQDKVEYVRKNLETLQETLQRKQDNMQLVGQIMQAKIQQASQAGAARASKS
jgi:prefoldin alpha subunit